MKQEEKELLLKDLCGRLPYGFLYQVIYDDRTPQTPNKVVIDGEYTLFDGWQIHEIKPYLRPMSSMTEEESEEFFGITITHNRGEDVDWLNAHHFDYRIDPSTGKTLIESGLAIEAPDGMYGEKHEKPEEPKRIPATIEEALDILDDVLTEEDKEYLVKNGAISVHLSLGMWIRNEWKLWEPVDSDIKTYLKKEGYEHPDDMSNYIIEEFIKYLNNKL